MATYSRRPGYTQARSGPSIRPRSVATYSPPTTGPETWHWPGRETAPRFSPEQILLASIPQLTRQSQMREAVNRQREALMRSHALGRQHPHVPGWWPHREPLPRIGMSSLIDAPGIGPQVEALLRQHLRYRNSLGPSEYGGQQSLPNVAQMMLASMMAGQRPMYGGY